MMFLIHTLSFDNDGKCFQKERKPLHCGAFALHFSAVGN